jgi:toxin ParE1/3/4
VRGILFRLDQLRSFPETGAPRDHIRPGLRAAIKRPYVAYYLLIHDEIVVLRVLHGSRDLAAISDEGGFQN